MTADQQPALRRLASAHRKVVALGAFALCCVAPPMMLPFGYTFRGLIGDYGATLVLASPVYAVLLLVAAYFMERTRYRRLVMGVAMLSLIYVPLGTLLGIVTLMVIRRPAVKAAFDGKGVVAQR
jgi:hypothetical protein